MSGQVSRFEHFEIRKDERGELIKLGPGGMGTTYRAYDLHLRKLVALKIINDRTLADPTARRRFFNEARVAASIDHPNVARVIYLCPEDAVDCFFAMELVEGETLAKRIASRGAVPPGEALALLRPIADALAALGARGLVHRDIKPENIMLTHGTESASEVKLIDFGLAKTVSANSSIFESVHTGERFVGSVYFASPEQIRPTSGGVDCRSDFYSLGATLWHVVTGAPPFKGTVFEVQEAHVYKEPPWAQIAQLPEPLHALLRTLLAKEPALRPADAEALLNAWDHAMRALESCDTRLHMPSAESPQRPVGNTSQRQPDPVSLPADAAVPPASGSLVRDGRTSALHFVRRLPAALVPEVHSALVRAAQAVRDLAHPGLLGVRELSENSIVCEWPPAATAAQVAHWQGGQLPAELLLAWLPRLAVVIDAAHARGLAHLSLQPDRLLVECDAAGARATDLARWKSARLWLDPLAAFDGAIASAAKGGEGAGMAVQRVPACTTVREYIAALARSIRDLMTGGTNGRGLPVAALDEPRNKMLSEAINYRANTGTVVEWAKRFLAGGEGAGSSETARRIGPLPAKPAQPVPPPPKIAAQVFPRPRASSAPPPVPPATRQSVPPVRRIRSWRLPLVIGASLSVGLLAVWGAWAYFSSADRESEEFRTLLAAADDALAKGDRDRAWRSVASAEQIHPHNPRLPDYRARVSDPPPPAAPDPPSLAAEDPIPAKPDPAPASATPAPLTSDPDVKNSPDPPQPVNPGDPGLATVAQPFLNSLGMKFVPVPITGGPTHGEAVLFSVYETRVSDFLPFVKPGVWGPQAFQKEDHPAVNIAPADAIAYARWLNRRERLPGGWYYRLPTDHEWSCVVGIGSEESAEEPASRKVRLDRLHFPWGRVWPPPLNAGNLADESFRSHMRMMSLAGYRDGYVGTAPVGASSANNYGVHDLAGNAAEWCEDAAGDKWVVRGGSWMSSDISELESSARGFAPSDARREFHGFRLVLTKSSKAAKGRASKATSQVPQSSAIEPPFIFTR